MSLKIENIKIVNKNVSENKELNAIVKTMEKHGVVSPMKLLPTSTWQEVELILKESHSQFANAIRRGLIEEVLVKCMNVEEKDFQTDDEFILSDMIIKNLNLIPIHQNYIPDDRLEIQLFKYNDTNDIIKVRASDIKIITSSKRGGDDHVEEELLPQTVGGGIQSSNKRIRKTTGAGPKEYPLSDLIPDSNITIIHLRPGKFVELRNIFIEEGYSKHNAAKFSLLDNVRYKVLDMKPYEVYTDTGTRSMEYNPKEFLISFRTSANITAKEVMEKLCNSFIARLSSMKDKVIEYSKNQDEVKHYVVEGCEINIREKYTEYLFMGEYITLGYMVAQRCYLLDPNILYITGTISRYDNEIAIINLQHADKNKLLIRAIDSCIDDIKLILDAFKKAEVQ